MPLFAHEESILSEGRHSLPDRHFDRKGWMLIKRACSSLRISEFEELFAEVCAREQPDERIRSVFKSVL